MIKVVKKRRRDVLLDCEKHALDVQIHDFVPGILLICLFEFTTPGGSCIGKENVHVIGMFADFLHKAIDFRYLGAVGRDGDGYGARRLVGEGI
jgi:hypothetical protein